MSKIKIPLFFPKTKVNKHLLYCIGIIAFWGLISLLSASTYESEIYSGWPLAFFVRQLIAMIIGLVIIFAVSRVKYQFWRFWALPLALFCIIALCMVNFTSLGVNAGGSDRWLNLGPFSFQPSEIAKIATILLMADGLTRDAWFRWPVISRLCICALMCLLILIEPDLGSALMIIAYCGFLLFIRGMNIFLIALMAISGSSIIYWMIAHTPYQQGRIIAWMNPESDPMGLGYNLLQSKYAIAHGGLWGQGYGNSVFKLGFLPVSYSDFIFPTIAEEFGIIGTIVIIAAFVYLLIKGFQIAMQAPCNFGKLIGLGIVFGITVQTIVNLGGATGLLPITGMPLPLISYGKTSLLIIAFGLGILLNQSRYIHLRAVMQKQKAQQAIRS